MKTTALFHIMPLILLLQSSEAFRSVTIGPPFRNSSRLTPQASDLLASACGLQPRGATTRRFPWAVSLLVKGRNLLGGAIISPYHILTAAHGFVWFKGNEAMPCLVVRYRSPSQVQRRDVVYGGLCIRGNTTVLPNHPKCQTSDVKHNKIRSVTLDAGFAENSCGRGHDWAIVELEDEIIFDDTTAPICLPSPRQRIHEELTVSGWGRGYVFNDSSPYLRETVMRHDPWCRAPWTDNLPTDADDYLCAVSLNTNDFFAPRTCHGDSGSGVEQTDFYGRSTLVGVVSFGSKGCPANELARFTKVDNYLEAICEITGVCYSLNQ